MCSPGLAAGAGQSVSLLSELEPLELLLPESEELLLALSLVAPPPGAGLPFSAGGEGGREGRAAQTGTPHEVGLNHKLGPLTEFNGSLSTQGGARN